LIQRVHAQQPVHRRQQAHLAQHHHGALRSDRAAAPDADLAVERAPAEHPADADVQRGDLGLIPLDAVQPYGSAARARRRDPEQPVGRLRQQGLGLVLEGAALEDGRPLQRRTVIQRRGLDAMVVEQFGPIGCARGLICEPAEALDAEVPQRARRDPLFAAARQSRPGA
jgi:hypothetical protein